MGGWVERLELYSTSTNCWDGFLKDAFSQKQISATRRRASGLEPQQTSLEYGGAALRACQTSLDSRARFAPTNGDFSSTCKLVDEFRLGYH